MALAVDRWTPSAESQVRSQASSVVTFVCTGWVS
jgi:hypothetical protein